MSCADYAVAQTACIDAARREHSMALYKCNKKNHVGMASKLP